MERQKNSLYLFSLEILSSKSCIHYQEKIDDKYERKLENFTGIVLKKSQDLKVRVIIVCSQSVRKDETEQE